MANIYKLKYSGEAIDSAIDSITGLTTSKQDTLVSGTNIKTINGNSLLVTSTDNTDVSVQPVLVSGTNIKTINGASILGNGDIAIKVSANTAVATSTTDGLLSKEDKVIIDALPTTYLKSADLDTFANTIATTYAKKTDVTAVYKYVGSVATYSALPTSNQTVGYVYNVESDGINYAWNGTIWDSLSGTVDLTNYYTKTEVDTTIADIAKSNSDLSTYFASPREPVAKTIDDYCATTGTFYLENASDAPSFNYVKDDSILTNDTNKSGSLFVAEGKQTIYNFWKPSDSDIDITLQRSLINLNQLKTNCSGMTVSGASYDTATKTLTISASGSYTLSGYLDGNIVVNIPSDVKTNNSFVNLILNGLTIYTDNSNNSIINSDEYCDLQITLKNNTKNYLILKGDAQTVAEGVNDDTLGVIYSAKDLDISGTGYLAIYANKDYIHGINGSDIDISMYPNIYIKASHDGIHGRKSLTIESGYVFIDSPTKDGIEVGKDSDTDDAWFILSGGYLYIKNCGSDNYGIKCKTKGTQCGKSSLYIEDCASSFKNFKVLNDGYVVASKIITNGVSSDITKTDISTYYGSFGISIVVNTTQTVTDADELASFYHYEDGIGLVLYAPYSIDNTKYMSYTSPIYTIAGVVNGPIRFAGFDKEGTAGKPTIILNNAYIKSTNDTAIYYANNTYSMAVTSNLLGASEEQGSYIRVPTTFTKTDFYGASLNNAVYKNLEIDSNSGTINYVIANIDSTTAPYGLTKSATEGSASDSIGTVYFSSTYPSGSAFAGNTINKYSAINLLQQLQAAGNSGYDVVNIDAIASDKNIKYNCDGVQFISAPNKHAFETTGNGNAEFKTGTTYLYNLTGDSSAAFKCGGAGDPLSLLGSSTFASHWYIENSYYIGKTSKKGTIGDLIGYADATFAADGTTVTAYADPVAGFKNTDISIKNVQNGFSVFTNSENVVTSSYYISGNIYDLNATPLTTYFTDNTTTINNPKGTHADASVVSTVSNLNFNDTTEDNAFLTYNKKIKDHYYCDTPWHQMYNEATLDYVKKRADSGFYNVITSLETLHNKFSNTSKHLGNFEFDISSGSIAGAFKDYTNLISINMLDITGITDISNLFNGCKKLFSIPLFDTSSVTNFTGAFNDCEKLVIIPAYDVSKVTNFTNAFTNCAGLTQIHMTGIKASCDISASTLFTESALMEILNNLSAVDTAQTLTIGTTNLTKLTDAEKSSITSKNWYLA